MSEQDANRSIRIEGSAFGSAIVSGDGNTIYIIQQAVEQLREETTTEGIAAFGPNPYKGLAAFKECDTDRYFGREIQVERLWQRFQDLYEQFDTPRFLPILGPSGCGKSSLARAGLLPELARHPISGREKMRIVVMLPGESPLKSLAGVLARLNRDDQTPEVIKKRSYEEELRKSSESSRFDFLQDVAATLPDIEASPLVVLVDQFEETYSLCKDFRERTAFIENLLYAACSATRYVTVVITLRSDFWSETQRHEQLNQIIGSDQSVNLPAMAEDELRRSIAEPEKQAGNPLNEAVTELLINDTKGREGTLPLLQFSLTRIWEGLIEGKSPIDTYRKMGGVGGALAGKAQEIYNNLNNAEKDIVRRVFVGLVQLGDGTRDTRRRATIDSLRASQDTPEAIKNVINRFSSSESRLLTLSSHLGQEIVEVTHEALFDHWQQLKDWLDSSRDDIRFQRRLEAAATYWDKQGRPSGLLWRSPDLDSLRALQKDRGEISKLSISFFETSDQVEKREIWLKRSVIAGLSSLLLLATGLAGIAFVQFRSQKKLAVNSNIIAQSLTAENLLASNLSKEALIAIVLLGRQIQKNQISLDKQSKMQAISAMREVIYGVKERNRLQSHSSTVHSVSFSPDGQTIASASADKTIKLWDQQGNLVNTLVGHNGWVNSSNFSPDGQTIASASADKTIKLWNRQGNLINTLVGHVDKVHSVSFSPDGQTIASASADKTIKLWDQQGNLVNTFMGHTDMVISVRFSPDGQTIASASADKTIKLWDQQGNLINTLVGHSGWVSSVRFSPDGQTIASASYDKTIKLWNRQGNLVNTLVGHNGWLSSVSFSPDGQTIASASGDRTIKLWDRQGNLVNTLAGHAAWISNVSFSPDSQTIASASNDNTIRLWDQQGNPVNTFMGHTDAVVSVSFSPDSQTIASASDDNTVKLWDQQGNLIKTLIGHADKVYSVSFSPDGQAIASASVDNTVKLWDQQGNLRGILMGHTDNVSGVSFSPDSQTIASASDDNTVKLWDRQGNLVNTFVGHTDRVVSVSFSSDGQMIASASADKTIKLWDRQGTLVNTLTGHTAWISSVVFSPDGQMIASASADKTIKLWDRQGNLVNTLIGHSGWVNSVSFSPSGQTIASAGYDNTVKLWDRQGNLINTLVGHADRVYSVSFSPDAQAIVSAGADKTIKLWNFNLDNLLEQGCRWLQDYLTTNPTATEKERQLCD